MAHTSAFERVRETIDAHDLLLPGGTVVVGVSGGHDSLCLLHVLARLVPTYRMTLHVGHLDHGIRGEASEADAQFVAALCLDWGIPCTIERAQVPTLATERGLALEEAARQARYGFLARLARGLKAHTVAVGHHADDQVETVLMHLLRGAGLGGLRGMRPLTRLDALHLAAEDEEVAREGAPLRLIRPLLNVWRAEIEEYVAAEGLQPRYDRSNLDTTYYRNRLRQVLIPHLETYNPRVREVLHRTAEALAGDYQVLRETLAATWDAVVLQETEEWILFDLSALQALSPGQIRSVIREAIQRLRRSLRDISWAHITGALDVLAGGQTGAEATLPARLSLRLGYDRALLTDAGRPWPTDDLPRIDRARQAHVPGITPLEGDWLLEAKIEAREALPPGWQHNPNPLLAYLDATRLTEGPLVVRPRRTGDVLAPLGMGGRHQKITDFMINRKVPAHERERVPLLVRGDELAWVVGWSVDQRYAVREGTESVAVLRAYRAAAPPCKGTA